MSPEEFVEISLKWNCQGTSISFNEPTLALEWSLDVFQLARARGLYNTYVTNGYMTSQALEMLFDAGLDAMNVDLKGDLKTVRKFCGGVDAERVWARCRQAKHLGIHLEITTLVIPGVNDRFKCLDGIARRIADELGPSTPWHVTRYHPAYRFTALSTPASTLKLAWNIGAQSGLKYIYVGNITGDPLDNTRCPKCNSALIERFGFHVKRNAISKGCCPDCGDYIEGVGWDWDL
jgi:pyruvate formate lyase activating enzyme